MPTLSRYFIRSALIFLGIGFTFGGLILSAKGGYVDPRVWNWLPMHIVLLIDGWLIQLTLGVAYWILPRIQLSERGRGVWAWTGFAAMQIGLAMTLITALTMWLPDVQVLFAPAVILQAIGVLLFAVHAWPRIRPAMVRAASAA
ncbi:MAG: hypothetical protein KF716_22670 [Anaerolineae bacterium]|nr:hypothetical protein [Anaerolineae bacterium]